MIQALVVTKQEHLAELLDQGLAQHFKNLETTGEAEEEPDFGIAAATEKPVHEKVSEIRMSLNESLMFCLLFFRFICFQ